jgi:hypothetical protein
VAGASAQPWKSDLPEATDAYLCKRLEINAILLMTALPTVRSGRALLG